jgi:hypothetical protein
MALQLIFGMTFSNLDDYLLFAKRIIVKVLRNDQPSLILPSPPPSFQSEPSASPSSLRTP